MADPTNQDIAARHIASLDFEFAKADVLERLKFQASFGDAVWRSLALVNGGAIVALFTFIGNAKSSIDENLIWTAFGFFVTGLVLNILSIMTGFLAQLFYMKATTSAAWNKQAEMHGYPPNYADEQAKEQGAGDLWEAAAVMTAVLSLAVFGVGATCALKGVTVAQIEPNPSASASKTANTPYAGGRYQVVQNAGGRGVYVLDTSNGQLRLCMTGPVGGPGTIGIACMAPSTALSRTEPIGAVSVP